MADDILRPKINRTRRLLNQQDDSVYKKAYSEEILLLYADDMLIEFKD